jgi:hypothetical protein
VTLFHLCLVLLNGYRPFNPCFLVLSPKVLLIHTKWPEGAARPYLMAKGALAHSMAEDSLLPVRDGIDTTHLVC